MGPFELSDIATLRSGRTVTPNREMLASKAKWKKRN
jgi:hypothetical protein